MKLYSYEVVFKAYRHAISAEELEKQNIPIERALLLINDKQYEYYMYNTGIAYLEHDQDGSIYLDGFCSNDEIEITSINEKEKFHISISSFDEKLSQSISIDRDKITFPGDFIICFEDVGIAIRFQFSECDLAPQVVKARVATIKKSLQGTR